jgi:hypothetical protein
MAILGYIGSPLKMVARVERPKDPLPTAGLPGWLAIATDKLIEPARERVSREIESHFADAIDAHVKEGESAEASRAAALAELGDPYAAGKSYRRKYLTQGDIKHLERARLKADSVRGAGMLLGIALAYAICVWRIGPDYVRSAIFATLLAASVLACALLPLMLRVFAWRRGLNHNASWWLIINEADDLCWALASAPLYALLLRDYWLIMLLFTTFAMVPPSFIGTIKLWNKVRRTQNIFEAPPPTTPAPA